MSIEGSRVYPIVKLIPLILLLASCSRVGSDSQTPYINCSFNPQEGVVMNGYDIFTNRAKINNFLTCRVGNGDNLIANSPAGLSIITKRQDNGTYLVSFKIGDDVVNGQRYNFTLVSRNGGNCLEDQKKYQLNIDKSGPQVQVLRTDINSGHIVQEIQVDDKAGLSPILRAGIDKPNNNLNPFSFSPEDFNPDEDLGSFTLSLDGHAVLNIQAYGIGEQQIRIVACDALLNCATHITTANYNPFSGISAEAVFNQNTGHVEVIINYDDPSLSINTDKTTVFGEQEGYFWPTEINCQNDSNQSPNSLRVICTPRNKKRGEINLTITVYDHNGNIQEIQIPASNIDSIPNSLKAAAWLTSISILAGLGLSLGYSVNRAVNKKSVKRLAEMIKENGLERAKNFLMLEQRGGKKPRFSKKERERILNQMNLLINIEKDIKNGNIDSAYKKLSAVKELKGFLNEELIRIRKMWLDILIEKITANDFSAVVAFIRDIIEGKESIDSFFNFFRKYIPSLSEEKKEKAIKVYKRLKIIWQIFNYRYEESKPRFTDFLINLDRLKEPKKKEEYISIAFEDLFLIGRIKDASDLLDVLKSKYTDNQFSSLFEELSNKLKSKITEVKKQLEERFDSITNKRYETLKDFFNEVSKFFKEAKSGVYWDEEMREYFDKKTKEKERRIKKEIAFMKVRLQVSNIIEELKNGQNIDYSLEDIINKLSNNYFIVFLLFYNPDERENIFTEENKNWFSFYMDELEPEKAERFLQALVLLATIPRALLFGGRFNTDNLTTESISLDKKSLLMTFKNYFSGSDNDKGVRELYFFIIEKLDLPNNISSLDEIKIKLMQNFFESADNLNKPQSYFFMRFARSIGFRFDSQNENMSKIINFFKEK